jgi:TfoX/Sxy family transcriptional regulator of competence genes
MEKFTKPQEDTVRRFTEAAEAVPGAQRRKMFGYEAFFIHGHFAAGLWANTVVFKLDEKDLAAFLKLKGAGPFAPMRGRVMKQWGLAPEGFVKDGAKLKAWCLKAARYAASLPPKETVKKKKVQKKK